MTSASTCSLTQIHAALQVFTCLNMTSFMCPPDTPIDDVDSINCDYIIVGAGYTGSVIANRLTEDSQRQVCLIDAGGDPPLETLYPGLFPYTLQKENMWNYNYEADSENPTWHQGQVSPLPLMKWLGGSSNINFLYERGNPEDYDEWATLANNKIWNYEQALKAFIKSETLYDSIINDPQYNKYHGTNGYLGITRQRNFNSINKYLEAAKEIGHEILVDYNIRNVTGYGQAFLTEANNQRQTATFSFLTPIRHRTNLKVLKYKTVVQITVDEKKYANGVCFIGQDDKKVCLTAKKEVIIAAGAINTVKILLNSGIGPKKHLEKHDINCISDLPVGKNLIVQDFFPMLHLTEKKIPEQENLGPYVFPIPLFVGRVATTENFAQYRALNYIVTPDYVDKYCRGYLMYDEDLCDKINDEVVSEGREIVYTELTQYKKFSRGYVELKSSDYLDAPIINLGWPIDNRDIEITRSFIKDFRRIYKSSFFESVGAKQAHLGKCLDYDFDSNDYWDCQIKGGSTSNGEHSGTCAMGSVVDSRLHIKGIGRLRIAGSAVIPIPISAKLYATNVIIGEIAAQIIIEDERNNNQNHITPNEKSSESSESESNESGSSDSKDSKSNKGDSSSDSSDDSSSSSNDSSDSSSDSSSSDSSD